MRFPGFRSAMTLLADLLHLLKGVYVDDGRMRIVEHCLVFYGIWSCFFVPDRVGVRFEVDHRNEDERLSVADVLVKFKRTVLRENANCIYTAVDAV